MHLYFTFFAQSPVCIQTIYLHDICSVDQLIYLSSGRPVHGGCKPSLCSLFTNTKATLFIPSHFTMCNPILQSPNHRSWYAYKLNSVLAIAWFSVLVSGDWRSFDGMHEHEHNTHKMPHLFVQAWHPVPFSKCTLCL